MNKINKFIFRFLDKKSLEYLEEKKHYTAKKLNSLLNNKIKSHLDVLDKYVIFEVINDKLMLSLNEKNIQDDLRTGNLLRKKLNYILDKCYTTTIMYNIKTEFKQMNKRNNINLKGNLIEMYEYGKIFLNNLSIDLLNNTYIYGNKKSNESSINNMVYSGNVISILNSISKKLLEIKNKKNLIITSEKMLPLWHSFLSCNGHRNIIIINNKVTHDNATYYDLEQKKYIIITYEYITSSIYKDTWKDYLKNGLKLKECFNQQKLELKCNKLWNNMCTPNIALINWTNIIMDDLPINNYINDISFRKIIDQLISKKKVLVINQSWLNMQGDIDLFKLYGLFSNNSGFWSKSNLRNNLIKYTFIMPFKINKVINLFEKTINEREVYEYFLRELMYNTKRDGFDTTDYFEMSKNIERLMDSGGISKNVCYLRDKVNEFIKDNSECCICKEKCDEKKSIITKCGHIYHFGCMIKSLEYKNTCPICRNNIELKDIYPIFINKSCDRIIYKLEEFKELNKKVIVIGDNLKSNNFVEFSEMNNREQQKLLKKYNNGRLYKIIRLKSSDRHLISLFKNFDEIVITETHDLLKTCSSESFFLGLGEFSCFKKDMNIRFVCYDSSVEQALMLKMYKNIQIEK